MGAFSAKKASSIRDGHYEQMDNRHPLHLGRLEPATEARHVALDVLLANCARQGTSGVRLALLNSTSTAMNLTSYVELTKPSRRTCPLFL